MLVCKRCAAALTVLRNLPRRFATLTSHDAARLTEAGRHRPDTLAYHGASASSSRRHLKKTRSSPTKTLADSLEHAGLYHATPTRRSPGRKLDISYFDPLRANNKKWNVGRQRVATQSATRVATKSLRLQTVLAEYITWLGAGAVSPFTLTGPQQALLLARGYSMDDVRIWARILIGKDTFHETKQMLLHTTTPFAHHQLNDVVQRKPLPAFVFLFFLRRQTIHPKALRNLVVYAWWALRQREEFVFDRAKKFPPMDDSSLFTSVVRLIRHARACLPEALFSITRVFIRLMSTANDSYAQSLVRADVTDKQDHLARKNDLYNRVITLLSVPSSPRSFLHAPIHQDAQFECLRSMAEHRPPLYINREGYNAISRIQLANRKTTQEQDWASMKAKSWPPWKQDRLGLDSEKGIEYGTSRALETIERGIEAGYPLSKWEHAAKILSGWDTDGSPTIQTRAMLFHRSVSAVNRPEVLLNDPGVWTSRIRATRTLPEAWAAFLGWKERRLAPLASIYFYMLQKIAMDGVRTKADQRKGREADAAAFLPGDGLETHPTPKSESEAIYIREPLPTFTSLAMEMYLSGVFPSNEPRLALFLLNSPSWEEMVKYLRWASEKDDCLVSLIYEGHGVEHLQKVDPNVFIAYLEMLCAAARGHFEIRGGDGKNHDSGFRLRQPLRKAIHLLFTRNPHHPKAWHVVLEALARDQPIWEFSSLSHFGKNRNFHRWNLLQDILNRMREHHIPNNPANLLEMCRCLESAICSAKKLLDEFSATINVEETHRKRSVKSELVEEAVQILEAGSSYARTQLRDIYGSMRIANISPVRMVQKSSNMQGSDYMTSESTKIKYMPLEAPHLPLLHAYLRVQGQLGAWQELLTTVQWMAAHKEKIKEVIGELKNGQRMLRKCFLAIRIFSGDVPISSGPFGYDQGGEAPARIQRLLMRTVESVEDWGGWPSDLECAEYQRAENSSKMNV